MDWFRWHSGTVTDPKFQWVARYSKQSVAVVIAMWAVVLERANDSDDRGKCDGLDFESLDIALGLDDGAAKAVYETFERKEMIVAGEVANWIKRQPKHEDGTAAERKRRQRLKEKESQHVTECHAESQHVTTEEKRIEEKREEKEKPSSSSSFLPEVETKAAVEPDQEPMMTAEKASIFQVRVWHEQYFNQLMPGGLNKLAHDLCRGHPASAIEAAFEAAARYGVPKMAYVQAVLTGEPKGRSSPSGGIDWEAVTRIRQERGLDGSSVCTTGFGGNVPAVS